MFEFRLKWFNQEREEEHLVIFPPCVFWLSHWLWKPYLSGVFNLWVLPTLSKLLQWAISDRPGSFTDVHEKDYKCAKEFSGGEIYGVCCKSSLSRQMALLFSLCAMTGIWSFTLRSKGEPINVSPLWRSKWYTSCCDPHNRWFSWQTSVRVCVWV